MSKTRDNALATIERLVFESDTPIVVALTGGWGEGKTHFWNEVIVPSHSGQRPGYISVFGAESMVVIRERVAVASARLLDFVEEGTLPEWLSKAASGVASGARRAINFWVGKIGLSDSIAIELLQTFGLQPGWIVCIDDVERLSASVGYENLLGYVAELRDKWKLKVVLIYNREPIESDANSASVFDRYYEKVIDRAIPFTLDYADLAGLAFGKLEIPGMNVPREVQAKSELLGLRNIRILSKAKHYFDELLSVVGPGASTEFLQAVLNALLLFTYTKFSHQKPEALTFDLIAGHSMLSAKLLESAGVEKPDETRNQPARELLDRYGYTHTDDVDRALIRFVSNDVLDRDEIQRLYDQYQKDSEKRDLERQFRVAYETHYHDTFKDNEVELCEALENALAPYLDFISPGELDFALSTLNDLGRSEIARRHFEDFKRRRGHIFENLRLDGLPHGTYTYPPLKQYFSRIADSRSVDERTLEEVMRTAFDHGAILSKDAARLRQFTEDELASYFLEHPQPALTRRLRTLAQAHDQTVRERALAAAQRIAATNPLNRKRMEGMGLVRRGDSWPDGG